MKRVLEWDRAITPQETRWSCGPAATRIVLNAKGIIVSEQELIREIGTHTDGTDDIGWIVDRAMANRAPQAQFQGVWLPDDPPNQAQQDALWEHLTRSIDAGWGLVVNWVSPPNHHPQPVKDSEPLQYPADRTVFHYVAYMGYDSDHPGGAVFVADSGFEPFESWISFDQACMLIPPKAYAWASSSPAVDAPPLPVAPPADEVQLDTLFEELVVAGVLPGDDRKVRFADAPSIYFCDPNDPPLIRQTRARR